MVAAIRSTDLPSANRLTVSHTVNENVLASLCRNEQRLQDTITTQKPARIVLDGWCLYEISREPSEVLRATSSLLILDARQANDLTYLVTFIDSKHWIFEYGSVVDEYCVQSYALSQSFLHAIPGTAYQHARTLNNDDLNSNEAG